MSDKILQYYTASWCAPRKRMKPIAKRIAAELGVTFEEIDVDAEYYLASANNIQGVPTIVIYDGTEPIAQLTPDMVNAQTIRKALA